MIFYIRTAVDTPKIDSITITEAKGDTFEHLIVTAYYGVLETPKDDTVKKRLSIDNKKIVTINRDKENDTRIAFDSGIIKVLSFKVGNKETGFMNLLVNKKELKEFGIE